MLKAYYQKVERFIPPNAKDDLTSFDVREHGLEGAFPLSVFSFTYIHPGVGPLEVSYPVLPSGLEKPFVEAMEALGVNPVPEPARVLPSRAHWCR